MRGDLKEAFRRAPSRKFEGSMAIGVMAADRPGEFVFGQKGSGAEGLFLASWDPAWPSRRGWRGLVEVTPAT
jgi:hypothetical protein